ncbi:phage protein NinX family protein [Klebsiella quasipneumoniae]|uniref:phage protein NinX family protein n=1 Tax=Klebsiella quasipneumoniae TaxID=1463165 RepID=UPI00344BA1D7
MTDYSKMSDQEINMAIAEIIFPDYKVIESKSRPPSACVISHLPSKWIDYCNNPADAWPIITANKISIYAMSENDGRGRWGVEAFYPNESYHFNDNPLRAAMIVFLKMQEPQNAKIPSERDS